MAHMTEVKCASCRTPFMARTADVKRGWGKFCSKSCKAKKQFRDTYISGPDIAAAGRTVRQMSRGRYNRARPLPRYEEDFDGEYFHANFSNEDGGDEDV